MLVWSSHLRVLATDAVAAAADSSPDWTIGIHGPHHYFEDSRKESMAPASQLVEERNQRKRRCVAVALAMVMESCR